MCSAARMRKESRSGKAIENFGLNPAEIPHAAIREDVLGYVEFHIEQGPVLENAGRPLGVVEAIAGQSRLEFTFLGQPITREQRRWRFAMMLSPPPPSGSTESKSMH